MSGEADERVRAALRRVWPDPSTIGKGQIRDRAKSVERADWEWDRIDYSIVEQEAEQFRWESWWLEWFEQKHGQLPHYNRIGGRRQ